MADNWWNDEWFHEWVRLARESLSRSPEREGCWIAFFNEDGELVYKYVKYEHWPIQERSTEGAGPAKRP
jgi:hypothetical protein